MCVTALVRSCGYSIDMLTPSFALYMDQEASLELLWLTFALRYKSLV